MTGRAQPVTNPIILEDIHAQLAATVYRAVRLAERQKAGQESPPKPSREDRIILRRSLLNR